MLKFKAVGPARLLAHMTAAVIVYMLGSLILGLCYGFFLMSGVGGGIDGLQASEAVGALFRSPVAIFSSIAVMLGLIRFQNVRHAAN